MLWGGGKIKRLYIYINAYISVAAFICTHINAATEEAPEIDLSHFFNPFEKKKRCSL